MREVENWVIRGLGTEAISSGCCDCCGRLCFVWGGKYLVGGFVGLSWLFARTESDGQWEWGGGVVEITGCCCVLGLRGSCQPEERVTLHQVTRRGVSLTVNEFLGFSQLTLECSKEAHLTEIKTENGRGERELRIQVR